MRNIGLVGRRRSGKDTVAARLVEQHGYRRVAFADPLKAAALALDPIVSLEFDEELWAHNDGEGGDREFRLSEIVSEFGWETAKDEYPEVRRLLQALGEGIRQNVGDHVWRDRAFKDIDQARWRDQPVVVTDCRYPDEASELRDRGFLLVRLTRPDVTRAAGDEHASESNTDAIHVDAVVRNNGTLEDLHRAVLDIVTE